MKKIKYFLLCFVFFMIGSISVNAEEIQDGVYEIQSALKSNMYIDLYGSKISNGTNIHLYQKNNCSNQKWIVKSLGDGYYSISSYINENYAMDIYGAKPIGNGSNIQLYKYSGTDNQKWIIKETGDGYYNIISKVNNLFVDVAGAKTKNGTNILTWENNNGKNQKFKFINVTDNLDTFFPKQTINDGNYIISTSLNDNKVLNIDNTIKSGSNVNIYDRQNSMRQIWTVKYLNDGYYSITSTYNEKFALEANGSSKIKNGTNVEIYNKHNGNNQKWIIKEAGDGYYYLVSKSGNLFVDLFGSKLSNGSNVGLWSGNGGKNQKFKFIDATETINNLNDYNDVFPEETLESGNYIITSALNTNYAVNINNSISNGTNINVYTNNNSLNEVWNIKYLGDGYYSISNTYDSDYVLDVYGATTIKGGSNVILYKNSSNNNQKWIIKKSYDGYYYIVSKVDNLFLNVSNDNISNGINMNVQVGNGTYNQKFKIEKTNITTNDNSYYSINSSANKNLSLNVYKSYKMNSTNVMLYNSENTLNELWKFKYNNDGFYSIISAMNPNIVLDVNSGSNLENTNVQIYSNNYSDNQKWAIINNKDGSISIVSKATKMYLTSASNNSGANIQMNSINNNANQKFILNKYKKKKYYKGIDVSSWQGDINWENVSRSGIDFVIIKAGQETSSGVKVDSKFENNVAGCKKYNIPYGVYIYSYADYVSGGKKSAESEAKMAINLINNTVKSKPTLGTQVFIDMEEEENYRLYGKETLTKMANKFCSTITSAGLKCGVYANKNWFNNYLNTSDIANKYSIWLAEYGKNTMTDFNSAISSKPSYDDGTKKYNYWQFTSLGNVSGINGYVDKNIGYDIFD